MDFDEAEACGRCAMSSVVDVAESAGDGEGPRDPFESGRIEEIGRAHV